MEVFVPHIGPLVSKKGYKMLTGSSPAPAVFPYVPQDLLDRLNEIFPDRCPKLSATERDVWAASGARMVIDRLQAEYNRQAKQGVFKR
jgi:hypothetical protein